MSASPSRRQLLRSSGVVAAVGMLNLSQVETLHAADEPAGAAPAVRQPGADRWHGLKVGVASYSLRGLKLDAVIAGIQRVGLNYVSIKDTHLSLKSTPDERKAAAAKFKEAGIHVLSCGVVKMENDEANIRNAFEYGRDIGAPVIVCNPHPESFPILDKLVKEFDIKLAIHNHGPESPIFKSPYDVMKVAGQFDERIGVCIDVGHTARAGVDPAEAIHKLAPRLYDVHLKDVADLVRRGSEVEIGRGVLDVPGILKALIDVKFAGHAGIEHEKDARDPLPGLAESVGYVAGVLRTIPA